MARTKIHAIWELFIIYFILILMEAVIQCWHNSSKQHLEKIKTQYFKSSVVAQKQITVRKNWARSEATKSKNNNLIYFGLFLFTKE